MATRTPKRATRSSAKQRANTPKKDYLKDPFWCNGVLVASGNEDYYPAGGTLVKLIKAARNEWASKKRLASGSKVNAGAVANLLRPYVKDPGINSTMRRGKATKHDENYVQSINIALTAIKPFPFEDYVYRGMNAKTPEAVLKFKSLMEQGELFVEPGLFSASALYPLPNSFQNMNTHFAIRSKSGRLIQAFSNRKDEWEVLFAAGTSFRILSFEDTNLAGWGRYKIVMEEVTSPIGGLTE